MTVHRFEAMGTWVEVRGHGQVDRVGVERLFGMLERRLSRFRPDSELCEINRARGPEVKISEVLADVLQVAEDLRERTGGLVDPAAGAAVEAWGYDRTFAEVRGLATPPGIERSVGWWSVAGGRLRREPGTRIDLGGIAKGWACDLAAEVFDVEMVNAGGDLRSTDAQTEVALMDPWGHEACVLGVGVGALATSSVARRRWRVGSGDAHHVIDPRTGAPARSPVLSATAVAASAAEAEAAAKAMLILGADGLAWAAAQPWIRIGVVVWHDGSVYATKGVEVAA